MKNKTSMIFAIFFVAALLGSIGILGINYISISKSENETKISKSTKQESTTVHTVPSKEESSSASKSSSTTEQELETKNSSTTKQELETKNSTTTEREIENTIPNTTENSEEAMQTSETIINSESNEGFKIKNSVWSINQDETFLYFMVKGDYYWTQKRDELNKDYLKGKYSISQGEDAIDVLTSKNINISSLQNYDKNQMYLLQLTEEEHYEHGNDMFDAHNMEKLYLMIVNSEGNVIGGELNADHTHEIRLSDKLVQIEDTEDILEIGFGR